VNVKCGVELTIQIGLERQRQRLFSQARGARRPTNQFRGRSTVNGRVYGWEEGRPIMSGNVDQQVRDVYATYMVTSNLA
jgi:hypothetical protein